MHLTPEILERTYELLRITPPFKAWKLPEVDDLEFKVSRSKATFAAYRAAYKNRPAYIEVSQHSCKNTHMLIEAMAHEMVHLSLQSCGSEENEGHTPAFWRRARAVCKQHGFGVWTF